MLYTRLYTRFSILMLLLVGFLAFAGMPQALARQADQEAAIRSKLQERETQIKNICDGMVLLFTMMDADIGSPTWLRQNPIKIQATGFPMINRLAKLQSIHTTNHFVDCTKS